MDIKYSIRQINKFDSKKSHAMEFGAAGFLKFEAPDYSDEGIKD